MLPGPRTAPLPLDSADPLGWRVANVLAIASPYLLAATLFAVLYLQPAAPAAQAALATPSAADPQAPAEPASAPVSAPATREPSRPAPAVSAKNAAAPASAPAALPAAAAPPTEPPLPTEPVPVQPDVALTMKLSTDAAPAYPPAASDAHIVGTVVVSATVGADGAVQSAQPVSGPALLEMAVLNAVRSWRYRPYLIYGKPVAFNTQVIIEFKPAAPPQ